MNIPKSAIFGFVFGLIAPFIGLFFGLQVSVFLGNLLMLPFQAFFALTGIPFGEMSGLVVLLLTLVSGVLWAAIFYVIARLLNRM
ncbi:MAG: hypothetical protein AAF614_19845 [Chloroflexota bacterium]